MHWSAKADRCAVSIGSSMVQCAIARTAHQKEMGLQYHPGLGPKEGILLDFAPGRTASIWMPETVRFPIDIVFVGPDRRVSSVVEHAQPGSSETWRDLAAWVLELPAGFVRRSGSARGAHVRIGQLSDLPAEWMDDESEPDRYKGRGLIDTFGDNGDGQPIPGWSQTNIPLDSSPYPVRAWYGEGMKQKRQNIREALRAPAGDELRGEHPGHRAVRKVHQALSQMVLPSQPRLRYTGTVHRDGREIVWVDAEVATEMGHVARFRVPVQVHEGRMLSPGVLLHNGAPAILTQESVKQIIARGQLSGPISDRPNLFVAPHGGLPRQVQPLSRRRAEVADHIDIAEHPVDDWSGEYRFTSEDCEIQSKGPTSWVLSAGTEVQILRDIDGHGQRYVCFVPEHHLEIVLERGALQ